MIDYANEDGLHLITMDEESSTICPDWQQRMLEILGEVEGDCGHGTSLVLTGVGKFFCNGLNLEKVVTRWQSHLIEHRWIPRRNNHAAIIRIGTQRFNKTF